MSAEKPLDEIAAEVGTTDDPTASRTYEWSHLRDSCPANVPSDMEANGDREKWCRDCRNRITLGTDDREYGHARDCEHHCYNGGVAE